jgi:DNA-binding Lrp family transcriptional regulator
VIEAYVMIMTSAGTSRELLPRIREIDGVRRANIVAGEFDVIVDVEAGDQQELLALVSEEIQSLPGVGRTRTCVVLE